MIILRTAVLVFFLPVLAHAGEAGDAVFAERGPWALEDEVLTWSLDIEGPTSEEFKPIDGGTVELKEETDPSDGQPILQMTEHFNGHERQIGPFPVSGGDPLLTFFLEQTVRDMARLTGGSPFYIRNRIKEALFDGGTLTENGDTTVATFEPFAKETEVERLRGFETLVLTFTMSDKDEPIRELRAETQAANDIPAYRNLLVLQ